MEVMAKIAFVIYTLIILGGGIWAVRSTSLVRGLIGLIATLLGVAGMYLLLATPFLAFMQILIYVGAVCVIIFFAVMLTQADAEGDEGRSPSKSQYLYSLLALTIPAAVVSWIIMEHPEAGKDVPAEVGIKALGKGLMSDYFIAFELISVVLLVAMSGAVLLAWQKRGKK